MKNLTYLFAAFFIISCNTDSTTINQPASQKKKEHAQVKLSHSNPVQLKNSSFVMFPLLLTDEETEAGLYKSSGRTSTYWNMAFYDVLNGESHLLDENRKMVIYQYDQNESGAIETTATKLTNLANKTIYYTVKTLDHNGNGLLDSKDPDYLFISDNEGKNFRQISPANGSVQHWQIVENTDKVLMMICFDDNYDKKFDENDRVTPMVFDLQTNTPSKNVFDAKFTLNIQGNFEKKWSTEAKK